MLVTAVDLDTFPLTVNSAICVISLAMRIGNILLIPIPAFCIKKSLFIDTLCVVSRTCQRTALIYEAAMKNPILVRRSTGEVDNILFETLAQSNPRIASHPKIKLTNIPRVTFTTGINIFLMFILFN